MHHAGCGIRSHHRIVPTKFAAERRKVSWPVDVVFDDDGVGAISVGGDVGELLPVLEVLSTAVGIGPVLNNTNLLCLVHSECARCPGANLWSW